MELTEQQLQRYREDGFLIVENYASMDQVERLRDRFEKIFDGEFQSVVEPDEYNWKKGRDPEDVTRQLVNIWKSDAHIAEVAFNERTARHVAKLQGTDSVRLALDMAIVKPPGSKTLAMHQDGPYMSHLDPIEQTSCWLALDDTYEEAGTLVYARGSHRWGYFPTVQFHDPDDWLKEFREIVQTDEEIELVPVVVKAGGAVFHSAWVWHGSGRNERRDIVRRAYVRVLIPSSCRHHPRIRNKFYSRYFGFEESEFDERFFPILWSEDSYRSPWVDRYPFALQENPPIHSYSAEAMNLANVR